jgi:hypothetical protein
VFLHTPAALELVKATGEFVGIGGVRYVEVDAREVLVTGVLSVGVQEIENDKVEMREGRLGKTIQQSVVGWWDLSSGAQAGARRDRRRRLKG